MFYFQSYVQITRKAKAVSLVSTNSAHVSTAEENRLRFAAPLRVRSVSNVVFLPYHVDVIVKRLEHDFISDIEYDPVEFNTDLSKTKSTFKNVCLN